MRATNPQPIHPRVWPVEGVWGGGKGLEKGEKKDGDGGGRREKEKGEKRNREIRRREKRKKGENIWRK